MSTTTYTGTDWAFDWYMDLDRKRRAASSVGDEAREDEILDQMDRAWLEMSGDQRLRAEDQLGVLP